MDKKNLFYKYTDFVQLQNIGGYWAGQVSQYFPIGIWVTEVAMWKIFLSQWNVPMYIIVSLVVIKYYAKMIMHWLYGWLAIRIGVYSAQNQYNNKKEHLNPIQVETIDTLKAICEKLGIQSKFTEL